MDFQKGQSNPNIPLHVTPWISTSWSTLLASSIIVWFQSITLSTSILFISLIIVWFQLRCHGIQLSNGTKFRLSVHFCPQYFRRSRINWSRSVIVMLCIQYIPLYAIRVCLVVSTFLSSTLRMITNWLKQVSHNHSQALSCSYAYSMSNLYPLVYAIFRMPLLCTHSPQTLICTLFDTQPQPLASCSLVWNVTSPVSDCAPRSILRVRSARRGGWTRPQSWNFLKHAMLSWPCRYVWLVELTLYYTLHYSTPTLPYLAY